MILPCVDVCWPFKVPLYTLVALDDGKTPKNNQTGNPHHVSEPNVAKTAAVYKFPSHGNIPNVAMAMSGNTS